MGECERSLRKGSWEWLKGRERGRSDTNLSQLKRYLKKKDKRSSKCHPGLRNVKVLVIPTLGQRDALTSLSFASLTDSRAEHFVLIMC